MLSTIGAILMGLLGLSLAIASMTLLVGFCLIVLSFLGIFIDYWKIQDIKNSTAIQLLGYGIIANLQFLFLLFLLALAAECLIGGITIGGLGTRFLGFGLNCVGLHP